MNINKMIEEIKAHPDSNKIGMIASHLGDAPVPADEAGLEPTLLIAAVGRRDVPVIAVFAHVEHAVAARRLRTKTHPRRGIPTPSLRASYST